MASTVLVYRWHPMRRIFVGTIAIAVIAFEARAFFTTPFPQVEWSGRVITILGAVYALIAVARVRLSLTESGDIECVRALWPFATQEMHHLEVRGRIRLPDWGHWPYVRREGWWLVSATGHRIPVDNFLQTDRRFDDWLDRLTILGPMRMPEGRGPP